MATRLAARYPHAFVTGVSSGLGRAFAEMLLAEGVIVWGTARDGARLTEMAAAHPAAFIPVVLDLAEPAAAEASFVRAAKAAGGAFDLLVNNAGYGVFGGYDAVEFPRWEAQVSAMLSTTMRLTHHALGPMRSRGRGCIVNISSLAAEFPLPYMSGYNVVKAGLSAFSESLIVETRGVGITVIDFRPGDFRTDFNHAMQHASPDLPAPAAPASRVWQQLEQHLGASPSPARAAADLRAALRRGRSGTVRSGTFFQARLAPWLARLAPASWRRTVTAMYLGGS